MTLDQLGNPTNIITLDGISYARMMDGPTGGGYYLPVTDTTEKMASLVFIPYDQLPT